MGGVWCKADRTSSHSNKSPINSAILRWTDNVRQAYRKQKTHRRPPRPPQKPLRVNEQLVITHPHLSPEASSNGWRTATLRVPESAPVPPPRKKRKRDKEMARTSYSMDDLSRVDSFNCSTISLHDKYHSEVGLDCRCSSSTLFVTPVLESRLKHSSDEEDNNHEHNKENININSKEKTEEEREEDVESIDETDVIIPVEKDILFNTRTILHSSLGYVDKLSAISEVSAESGFDDRTDAGKSSERSGSPTSLESISVKNTDLNILAHIQNINNVSNKNETNKDIREKTAISKTEWLQNILKEETTPYIIQENEYNDSEKDIKLSGTIKNAPYSITQSANDQFTPEGIELSSNHFNNATPLSTNTPLKNYTDGANHSVLLTILQNSNSPKDNLSSSNPFVHKEESIFMTNTKTNIIYKSLSSDNLTDDYNDEYSSMNETNSTIVNGKDISILQGADGVSKGSSSQDPANHFINSVSEHYLRDYSFETPKLVENGTLSEEDSSRVVSSFDIKDLNETKHYVKAKDEHQLTTDKPAIAVNGVTIAVTEPLLSDNNNTVDTCDKSDTKDPLTKKVSTSSSRRSSITDSLHEFEMSIYDMLKESKKNRDSSDEDESLKLVKPETK